MDVLTLLDLLIDELNRAAQVPLSGGKAMVDREKMIETVEQIKTALPEDITQAQQIKREREEIITEANREARDCLAVSEMERLFVVFFQNFARLLRRRHIRHNSTHPFYKVFSEEAAHRDRQVRG